MEKHHMKWRDKIMAQKTEAQTIIDMFAMLEPMDGVTVMAEGRDFIVEVACDTAPIHVTRAYVQANQVTGDAREKSLFLANIAATLHSTMVSLRALHDNPEAFADEE